MLRLRGIGVLHLVLGAVALGLCEAPSATATSPARCDRYASTHGSDGAPGTRARPFQSPARLLRTLHPGKTGCFRRGAYDFRGLTVRQPRITLTTVRGQRVTLKGTIKIGPTAKGVTVKGLRLVGSGGASETGPRIYANRTTLRGNDITNANSGTCVLIGRFYSEPSPRNVVIAGNRIHHCGRLPSGNTHHGIYISGARDAVIRGNWIYANADRGIQQYPDAQGSLITRNVIDSNGDGVNFGGDGSGACSNDNIVTLNVIANANLGWNAYSGSDGPTCHGNLFYRNCVNAAHAVPPFNSNGGIETPSRNFLASHNRIAKPRYVDSRAGDFRLRRNSRCAPILHPRSTRSAVDPRPSLLTLLVALRELLTASS